jgi:hypothetical protein
VRCGVTALTAKAPSRQRLEPRIATNRLAVAIAVQPLFVTIRVDSWFSQFDFGALAVQAVLSLQTNRQP